MYCILVIAVMISSLLEPMEVHVFVFSLSAVIFLDLREKHFVCFFFFFLFFFLIQFYVPFKIISAHMRRANQ